MAQSRKSTRTGGTQRKRPGRKPTEKSTLINAHLDRIDMEIYPRLPNAIKEKYGIVALKKARTYTRTCLYGFGLEFLRNIKDYQLEEILLTAFEGQTK